MRSSLFPANSLWHHNDFMKLWAGQIVSEFGSIITRDVLPLVAILTLSVSPAEVGILTALTAVPALVIGLPAGVWVDRLPRRPLLIVANLGRALLLLTIPIAAILNRLTLGQLYGVALLSGTLTVFFSIADNAYLPTLIERDKLVEGNSKLGVSSSLAEIGGPAVAGILVQRLSAPLTILVDVVTYLVSAVFLGLIQTPELPPTPPATQHTMSHDLREGLHTVWQTPVLRILLIASGTTAFFGSFIGALYGFYVVRTLQMTPAMLGTLISVGGIGALVGAAIAARLAGRWGIRTTLVGMLLLRGLNAGLIPLAGWRPSLAFSLLFINQLVGDVFFMVYLINDVTTRQQATPDHLLGRVNATAQFVVTGLSPLGLLLGGFLGQWLNLPFTLTIAAVGIFLTGVWLFFVWPQEEATLLEHHHKDLP